MCNNFNMYIHSVSPVSIGKHILCVNHLSQVSQPTWFWNSLGSGNLTRKPHKMCRPQSALSKNNLRRPKTICVVQKQSVKTLKPRYDGLQSEIGTHEQAHIKLLVITIGELAIVAKQEPFKGCNQFYHQNLHLNLNNFFKIKNENFSFESLRNKSRSKGAINSTTKICI